jgi:peptidoglycan/LPS O-acetylase OafA/YrhL
VRGFLLLLALVAFLAIPAILIPNYTPERAGGGIEVQPAPFLAMFGFGFLLAAAGHLYKSQFVVGLGIAIVFLALVLIPVALFATGGGG